MAGQEKEPVSRREFLSGAAATLVTLGAVADAEGRTPEGAQGNVEVKAEGSVNDLLAVSGLRYEPRAQAILYGSQGMAPQGLFRVEQGSRGVYFTAVDGDPTAVRITIERSDGSGNSVVVKIQKSLGIRVTRQGSIEDMIPSALAAVKARATVQQ